MIAAVVLVIASQPAASGSEAEKRAAARSGEVLPATLELDRQVAAAFQNPMLSELRPLFDRIVQRVKISNGELKKSPDAASGCDAAMPFLYILMDFSINNLQRENRYEQFSLDNIMRILDGYAGHLAICGRQAGGPTTSLITAELIKKL